MEIIGRIFAIIVTVTVIGVLLWFSAVLFAGLFFIGAMIYAIYFARNFLLEKNILNPNPGVPMGGSEESITIIEGDYEHVESGEKKD